MNAFKSLNRQDVYVSDYIARKQWIIPSGSLEDFGIELYKGVKDSTSTYNGLVEDSIYRSIKHNYYEGLESGVMSGSRDLSLQTTLTQPRTIADTIAVLSIPQNIFGLYITPSTFSLTPIETTKSIRDTGEGELVMYTGSVEVSPRVKVGDIIYNQGQVIFTDKISEILAKSYTVAWESTLPIYTYNVHCKVLNSEFNLTYNPTIQSGSEVLSKFEDPEFTPYVTTVGLYNGAQELLAVAKLNRPIPKSQNTDMTFIINLDSV